MVADDLADYTGKSGLLFLPHSAGLEEQKKQLVLLFSHSRTLLSAVEVSTVSLALQVVWQKQCRWYCGHFCRCLSRRVPKTCMLPYSAVTKALTATSSEACGWTLSVTPYL